jgi:hypothetical protein
MAIDSPIRTNSTIRYHECCAERNSLFCSAGYRTRPNARRRHPNHQKPHKVNLYLDSLGRTRSEDLSSSDTESEEITSVSILDPVTGFRYSLDPSTHSARQWSPAKPSANPVGCAKAGRRPTNLTGNPRNANHRSLHGSGNRTTVVYPVGSFGNTVQSRQLTKPGDRFAIQGVLTNISRSQPDPSLFQVPAGYQKVDAGPSPAPRRAQ